MNNGDTLYAWQEHEPSGDWGIIAAIFPVLGARLPAMGAPIPLVSRSEGVAMHWRSLALAHGAASGHHVRLARFTLDGVVE